MTGELRAEMRTRVKICGITNMEDALFAVECGADALGFIWVPESPRFVGGSEVRRRVADHPFPPFVSRVAVYTAGPVSEHVLDPVYNVHQYYGLHPIGAGRVNTCAIHAHPVRGPESLNSLEQAIGCFKPAALLLDAYDNDRMGGTGRRFDWDLANAAKSRFGLPVILAGGLTPENVGDAIAEVRPYAVDVSSGVEKSPGIKDHARLREFFCAVSIADRNLRAPPE